MKNDQEVIDAILFDKDTDKELDHVYIFVTSLIQQISNSISNSTDKNNDRWARLVRNVDFSERHIKIRRELLVVLVNIKSKKYHSDINDFDVFTGLQRAYRDAIEKSTNLYCSMPMSELRKLDLKTFDGRKANIDDYTSIDIGIKIATDQHFVLTSHLENINANLMHIANNNSQSRQAFAK